MATTSSALRGRGGMEATKLQHIVSWKQQNSSTLCRGQQQNSSTLCHGQQQNSSTLCHGSNKTPAHCVVDSNKTPAHCVVDSNKTPAHCVMEATKLQHIVSWKQQNSSTLCHGSNKTLMLSMVHLLSLVWCSVQMSTN